MPSRIKWNDYDGRDVKVWPEKTTGKGKVLKPKFYLLPDRLIRALDEAKKTKTSDYILVNQWSTSATLRKHLVKIGVRAKRLKRGLSIHGLRASEISMLPGVGVKAIMSPDRAKAIH